MRFTRARRLVSKHDFKLVFDKSHKISRQHLQILYRINTLPHARLGVIVAKQILPLSVDRNRIRRIIRESFRQHQADLGSVDVVVRLKPAGREVDNKTLRNEIDGVWAKCHSRGETP
jgi:ribonuclease P protein component